MSLVTIIRDYIDLVNSSYGPIPANAPLQSFLVPLLACVLGSIKQLIVYLVSFQWLRDWVYLPIVAPQLSLSALKEGCYPLENPLLAFSTFLEGPLHMDNKLLVGFFNSLFACLPLSAAHLLGARRLLVQGIPAGVAAGSGIVAGQCWLATCVILGLRPLLLPWLALEPFNYLLGVVLLVNIVHRTTHDRTRIRLTRWQDKQELVQYFLISFLLTWCEQTSMLQHLGNLTVGAEPTALDTFSSSGLADSILVDTAYLGGFVLGNLFFTALLGWLGLLLKEAWARWWSSTSRVTNLLNRFFLIALMCFSFASVPYYGIDYLVTNRLGFAPNDLALDGTIVSPTTLPDINQMLGRGSDAFSFDTDISTFDRGEYLPEDKPIAQSFEDLNYQGEYAWTRRLDKQTRHITMRKAHPFWRRLLGAGAKLAAPDEPGPSSRGSRLGVGGTSPSRPGEGQNGLVRSLEGEQVADLLDRRVEIAAELADVVATDDAEGGDALHPSRWLAEDKRLERRFMDPNHPGLSRLFLADDVPPSSLERALKGRYKANPLYSLLLRIDIDCFVGRQPTRHLLSPGEEAELFQRRQMLGQYYDALRQYDQLPNWNEFQALYHGSKSFANRVYNQQFKGTLKVVRRLFAVGVSDAPQGRGYRGGVGEAKARRDGESLMDRARVLRFDQPLFHQRSHEGEARSHMHEELLPMAPLLNGDSLEAQQLPAPFVEITHPRPLYAGWDEGLRKLILTNRSLARSKVLSQAGGIVERSSPSRAYGRVRDLLSNRIVFTAWPIREDRLAIPRTQPGIRYQMAFDSDQDPTKQAVVENLLNFSALEEERGEHWEMSSWPPNLTSEEEVARALPVRRGGFVWPGHAPLRGGRGEASHGQQ